MYYIKFVLLKAIYCPKCQKDVLHECGYLYLKDEQGTLIRQFDVHECISCGTVSDVQFHPVEVEFTLM